MNIDGKNKTLLYSSDSIRADFSPPKFSPDGEKILIVENTLILIEKNNSKWDNNFSIKSLNVSGNYPSFSPDGKSIIFLGSENEVNGIFTIDCEGGNKTRLTYEKRGGCFPIFSPNGKKITYLGRSSSGNSELWIMNSDGSDQQRLLKDDWYPDEPTFTPNGMIVLSAGRSSPYVKNPSWPTIWMLNPNTKRMMQMFPLIYSNQSGNTYPQVSPDGTMIICDHGIGTGSGLFYVEDPDGNGIWEDSDGDNVADVCDGAPNDPNEGYYKDDDNDVFCFENIFLSMCMILSGVKLIHTRT